MLEIIFGIHLYCILFCRGQNVETFFEFDYKEAFDSLYNIYCQIISSEEDLFVII